MKLAHFLNILIVGVVICWIVAFIFCEDKAVPLTNEDCLVEWTQVFLFLVAIIYCFLMVKGYRIYYNNTIAMGCFLSFLILAVFVVGEEISWGQRIFEIQTPDFLKEVNKQHEINFHNLRAIQRFRHWLLIGVGVVGLIMIFKKDVLRKILAEPLPAVLQPSANLAILFTLILVGGIFVEFGDLLKFFTDGSDSAKRIRFMAGRCSEIAELFLAFAVCWYSASKYYEMKRGDWKIRELLSRQA